VSATRLSALDASFLAVESAASPMHVGWVAVFEGPRPDFAAVRDHLASRLGGAPRYRQKLAPVPLGLHEPVWVDDPDFSVDDHLLHAEGDDLGAIVDGILPEPLPRDRPLWQIWIADGLPAEGFALVGKMHHCMVDGTAIADLGRRVLDADPAPRSASGGNSGRSEPGDRDDGGPAAERPPRPRPAPSPAARLARGAIDRTIDGARLMLAPARVATSPDRVRALPSLARTAAHTLLPPAPGSSLNTAGTGARRHVRVSRPLDDLRAVRKRFAVAPNDVILAACTGALRRTAERRGESPSRLKVMVPADVRGAADDAASGNRITFIFLELPCDEPDPVARLEAIGAVTAQRRRDGDAEAMDAAFGVLALTPPPLQRVLAHAFAHPRLFNLTISSVAGPAVPRYILGCRLAEVHSAVPLSGRHALSIGVVTVAGRVCFGLLSDPSMLPDAEQVGADVGASFDELVAAAT
jgi:diacylglycerol O-acyltransferase / wax synthase